MYVQDLLAACQIRVSHRDLTVETARAQQRRIQNVRAVGGGHEDHTVTVAETIHLHQQLVQGLLALVVAAAHAGATLAADRVNLVHEDDARRVLLRLLEQVAHTGGTHADKHLHEVGTGDREERHSGLARHGAGQQSLTGTGRTVQQHAARNLRTQGLVAGGVGQEVADLIQLLHCLIRTGDIVEGGIRIVLVQLLGGGLAKAEGAHATATLHAGQHEHQQAEDQQHRQQHHQQAAQEAILGDLCVELLRLGLLYRVEDLGCRPAGVLRDDLLDVFLAIDLDRALQLQLHLLLTIVDLSFLDVLVIQLLHGYRGLDLVVAAGVIS